MIIRIEQSLTDYNRYVDDSYPNPINMGLAQGDVTVLKVWATNSVGGQEFEFAVDVDEMLRAIKALKEYSI